MSEEREELELLELGDASEETKATPVGGYTDGGQDPPNVLKVNPPNV